MNSIDYITHEKHLCTVKKKDKKLSQCLFNVEYKKLLKISKISEELFAWGGGGYLADTYINFE